MNPLSTYGASLGSVLSKLAKNNARLGFEHQFSQIQNTTVRRINSEIERITGADDTPRKLQALEREYGKLQEKSVLITEFHSDLKSNQLRLETMEDDVYDAISAFTTDDDITNLTADEASTVQTKLDALIENIEALILTIHPDISQPHVIQDLKNELDTLKSYTPVEGTIDGEGSGSPTNDNRNLYDSLSSLSDLIDTASTVTATTKEDASQISLNIQATMATKVTDMSQLSNVELQRRQEQIDEVKANYGNMLRAISLSFEARLSQLEKLDESLGGQKIEPGSVMNLFT